MPRIKIILPRTFSFSTELPVRITDINYGGHLANDAFLAIAHEARVRFLGSMGYTEHAVEGAGMIMSDAAIEYKAEVFYGDVLKVDVGVSDLRSAGCDFVYRVTNAASGKEVARVKTGIAFFDYQNRKVVAVPDRFRARFEST